MLLEDELLIFALDGGVKGRPLSSLLNGSITLVEAICKFFDVEKWKE